MTPGEEEHDGSSNTGKAEIPSHVGGFKITKSMKRLFLENPKLLVKKLFGIDLTPTQLEILKDIIYKRHKRIIIVAMTRYGKSYIVSLALLLFAIFNPGKRVGIIGPSYKQCRILMDWVAHFILLSPAVMREIDIDAQGLRRLKREVSKERITLKNGADIRILSGEGSGERLLGFGFDIVAIDESAWITDETYRARILRMLGDDPDNAILIQIGNPFGNNHFRKSWEDPRWKKYHIDWRLAVKEGRTTQEFIDEMRRDTLENEFKILYDAVFVDEIGQYYPLNLIRRCVDNDLHFIDRPPDDEGQWSYFLGVDVARYGMDETAYVIVGTKNHKDIYVVHYETTSKRATTDVVGRVRALDKLWRFKGITIDETGLGSGPVDMLKEAGVPVEGLNFSSTEKRSEIYTNLKLIMEKTLTEAGPRLCMPNDQKLIGQLNSYTYEYASSGKLRVLKHESQHDDVSDALALACVSLKYGGRRGAVASMGW